MGHFLCFRGLSIIYWVLGVYRSFYRYQGCFGHIFVFTGAFWSLSQFMGYFDLFQCFGGGYFGLFLGLGEYWLFVN